MSRIRGIQVKISKPTQHDCDENASLEDVEEGLCTSDAAEKTAMRELTARLPRLGALFALHRKVGEGTFSSVYVGSLRGGGGAEGRRRLYAIKHLVPGAHPARVEHELRCLRDMGGQHHVVPLELCLRHLDTVVIIMPYIPHTKFSEYVGCMEAEEVAAYVRALLRALRHVHSFGVIHRDVKPSNFLYDRARRRYQLVDFGLAQRLPAPAPAPAPAAAPAAGPPPAKRPAREPPAAQPCLGDVPPDGSDVQPQCACLGVGGVCGACLSLGLMRAPRAGTQGFRPPEVLLKWPRQGPGVDVWAAGVVLCSVLCARYPLLRAHDDAAALAELAALLGTRALARAARSMRRRLLVSAPRPALCLHKLARRLREGPPGDGDGTGTGACRACGARGCLCLDAASAPPAATCGFPASAFALCSRLLEPDPALRPSAALALQHPFLSDAPDDSPPAPPPHT